MQRRTWGGWRRWWWRGALGTVQPMAAARNVCVSWTEGCLWAWVCVREGKGKTDVSAGWGDKRRAAIVEPEAWQRPGRGLVEPAWC